MDLPKDRTDRYERGVTQTQIVRYLMMDKNGAEEPKIRLHLKEELNLTSAKSIKSHLEKLEDSGLIKKIEQRGAANRWMLNYDAGYPLGKYLVDEILLPLSTNEEYQEMFINLFLSSGLQGFISSTIVEEFWKNSIFNFLILDKEQYSRNDEIINGIIGLIYESLHISPTLFIEMFYPQPKTDFIASLILYAMDIMGDGNCIYRDVHESKFLSPFIIDYITYSTHSTMLIGHLTEITMRHTSLKYILDVYKGLINIHSKYIHEMLSYNR